MLEGCVTIGALKAFQSGELFEGEKKRQKISSDKKRGRHITWYPNNHYECIREGDLIIEDVSFLDTHQPEESNFYIFKNTHQHASRDESVPLYEAAYKCANNTWIRVQKKHLKAAYLKCGRKDVTKMYEINEDGLPYWVDRYVFCKLKQIKK
jgi:hypothetical protein